MPYESVAEAVRDRAEREPDREFLFFEELRFTHAELYDRACRLANILVERVPRGTPRHIGVLSDNLPEFVVAFYAAALAGGVLVGLNTTHRGEELARDIAFTDVGLLLVEPKYAPLLDDATVETLSASERFLAIDREAPAGLIEPRESLEASLVIASSDDPDAAPSLDDLFVLVFTSGTTAAPKAVRCGHRRLLSTGEYVGGVMEVTPADRGYCAMPLFHSNAQQCGLMPALVYGASLALARRFSARGFLRDIRRYGCTYFNYTGSPLSYILMTPEAPDDADNPLRVAYGNEGSMEAIRRFGARFGCRVIDSFGATEGGFGMYRTDIEPAGSVGKAPPHIQVWNDRDEVCPPACFDADGRLANADECIGEIVNVDGAGKFEGYYGNEIATREKVRGGIFRSGDHGYTDADGFLYFVGRDEEWVRVEGENFPARPVEEIVRRHPDVAACAFYGVPDAAAGDMAMLCIVLRPGAAFDPDGFVAFLHAQPDLHAKAMPRFVRVARELPVTPSMKVLKRELVRENVRPDAIDDPIWYRERDGRLRPFDDAAYTELRKRFAEFGRTHLLEL
jgi:fatty-acyl-CoA synthase